MHGRAITALYPTNLDAEISAALNLAEVDKMFPLEGLDMKGKYALNLKANGVYDSIKGKYPGHQCRNVSG